MRMEEAVQKVEAKEHDLDPSSCKHEWEYKWTDNKTDTPQGGHRDQGIRTCKLCSLVQSRLDCATNTHWTNGVVKEYRAYQGDLRDDKVTTPITRIWMSKPHLLRSHALIHEDVLKREIMIIGAGAIGSFTVLLLSKLGCEDITVFEPDNVGPENTGPQLYGGWCTRANALGTKLNYLDYIISRTNPVHKGDSGYFKKRQERYEKQPLRGIVIAAVDSMESRHKIWNTCKGNPNVNWFIDPRMGAEQALMYVMNPCSKEDIKDYEKTLYDDKEAVQEPCTARATVYTAALMGGMITKTVKDLLMLKNYARVMIWNIVECDQKCFKANAKAIGKISDFIKKKEELPAAEKPPKKFERVPYVFVGRPGEEVILPLPLPEITELKNAGPLLPGDKTTQYDPADGNFWKGSFQASGERLIYLHERPISRGGGGKKWWWTVLPDGRLRDDG